MATATPDLASQWKGLNPQQRDLAMSRMTPDQKQKLATTLGFKRPAPQPTGDWRDPITRIQPHQAVHNPDDLARETERGFENIGSGLASVAFRPVATVEGIGSFLRHPIRGAKEMSEQFITPEGGIAPHALENAEAFAGQFAALGGAGELAGKIPDVAAALDPAKKISKAHEAVIADAGGDIIPRQTADTTTKIIRNQAAAMPGHVEKIMRGDPQTAFAAHLDVINQAKQSIDDLHESVLKPVENYPVKSNPIIGATVPTPDELKVMDRSDLSAANELVQRIGSVDNLRELNTLRKQLNSEDTSLKSGEYEAPSPGYGKMIHKAANAVRDAYYDSLQKATGKDFSSIKRDEGAVIEELRYAEKAQARLSQSETKAKTKLGRETAADVVSGVGHGGARGLPVVSAVAEAVRGTDLARLQTHLKKMYANLGQHVPPSVPGGPPAGQLRIPAKASSVPPPALPANASISNADEHGTVDTGGVPKRPIDFNVKPEGQSYPHERVTPGPPPPATGPTVPAKPAEFLRLPEKAGPGGEGLEPKGPTKPPPFDAASALNRTFPKVSQTIDIPQVGNYRVAQVNPNGEVELVPTRSLPAPAAAKGLLPSEAGANTVIQPPPQLPPVGYRFPNGNGGMYEVSKVGKSGKITLKLVRAKVGQVLPKTK